LLALLFGYGAVRVFGRSARCHYEVLEPSTATPVRGQLSSRRCSRRRRLPGVSSRLAAAIRSKPFWASPAVLLSLRSRFNGCFRVTLGPRHTRFASERGREQVSLPCVAIELRDCGVKCRNHLGVNTKPVVIPMRDRDHGLPFQRFARCLGRRSQFSASPHDGTQAQ
jgi:hypothetical protein